MKAHNIILALCLLISNSGSAQDDGVLLNFNCDTMTLNDSVFQKTDVQQWVGKFRDQWNLDKAVLTFNKTHLDSMYSDFSEFTNVRIYLTLPSNKKELPGAVLVPVLKSNCKHDIESCSLEARRLKVGGAFGPVSTELKSQMANWRNFSDTLTGLTPVYGFNFTWDNIWQACQNGTERLGVVFGISDLDDGSEGIEIHLYLTDGIPKKEERLFLDFSRPCPKMCGYLSVDN